MTTSTYSRKTGLAGLPYLGSFAWASLPAASQYTGYVAFASDLGANGAHVVSNGTRWRPLGGASTLKLMGAAVSGIANTETIVAQALIPAGAWQANDSLRLWVTASKSGTTNNCLLNVRVGTAGTTGDTAITGLNGFELMSTSGLSTGGIYEVKLVSNTSARKVGANATTGGSQSYSANMGVAAAVATAISDAAANALYVSIGLASGGVANTIEAQSAQIQLITP